MSASALRALIRENEAFTDRCFEDTDSSSAFFSTAPSAPHINSVIHSFEPYLSYQLPAYLNPLTRKTPSNPLLSTATALSVPHPHHTTPNYRLYRVIQAHSGWIRSIGLSHDNRLFATGSQDTTTKLFDLASGKLQLTLTGHVEGVRSVLFSGPAGTGKTSSLLYTSGEDDVVKIFDLSQNRLVHQVRAHKAGVYALAENQALGLLASAGRDRVIRLHDLRTKAAVHAAGLTGHTAAVECLMFRANLLISGSADATLRVWDVVAGRCVQTLTNHKCAVKFLAERADGGVVSGGSDAVRVWTSEAGVLEHQTVLHRPTAAVHAAALARESGVLAVAGAGGKIELVDANSGRLLQEVNVPAVPGSLQGEDALYAVAFDRSESRLIAAGADKAVKMFK